MVFENLNPELQKIVKKRFKQPTLPQQLAIQPILEGKNVLVIAPTGTGKCVSGDTLVLTENGPTPIKEIYGKMVSVNSCDDNLQIKMNTAIVIRKKKSKLYYFKTSTGRMIEVTDDHKFMIIKNGKISWVPLKDISCGDFVALSRKLVLKEEIPKISFDLFEKYLDKISISTNPDFHTILNIIMKKTTMKQNDIVRKIGCCKDTLIRAKKNNWINGRKLKKILDIGKMSTNSIEIIKIGCGGTAHINIPKINKDFSYFVGLIIGDGNFNVNNLRFTTASRQLLGKFKSFIKSLRLEVKKDKSRKYDYYVCSKPLLILLYVLGLPEKNKAANVKIPNILFSKYELLSAVLRGIFDTDGSIYDTTIELTTKSKILANEIIMALSCFDIFAITKSKTVDGHEYKRLLIQDVYNRRLFFKKINFWKKEKIIKLRETLHLKSNPNIDIIPEVGNILMQLKKDMGVKWSDTHEYNNLCVYVNNLRNPTRKNLIKVINYIKKFSRRKILTDEMIFLENLVVSDIFWDKVIEIKEGREDFVYDATVPEFHNFVGNGFILHNTESVMLPLFHLVMEQKSNPIAILYITPLRALNRDMLDRLLWWCNEIGIEASVRHGDTSPYERKQQAAFPPQLLITTPETLQAILPGKVIREHLKNVRYLVVDEVHEIVDSKRGTQLSLAIERLRELAGHDFQMIGLSATIGSPEKVASFLCPNGKIEIIKTIQPKAMKIKVISPKPEIGDGKVAKRLYTSPETAARLRTIMELVKEHRSTLTFTNTREFAEILSSRIKTLDKDFPAGIHHSSLSKEVRIKAEKEFKEEKIKNIVSTSSLQLGIDIGSVDLVLQYMSPRTISQCIQRIGRSGHEVERISKGIIISTDEDDVFESAVIARKALAEELEPLKLHENSYDVLAHQLVGLTMDNWKIDLQKAYEIVRRAYPYQKLSFPEFLEVCKQLQQLGLVFLNGEIKKKRRGFEYYFTQLSTIPDTKKYRVMNTLDNSFVGVLDEEFVALHGETNTTFILKGEAYKIISVEEDRIFVEPVEDIEAAIPGWEGELIPVPFEVAQEVGKLRSVVFQKLKEKSDSEIVQDLVYLYPVDENSARKMLSLVKKQSSYGVIPDDKTILIEDHENSVILHTCFGSIVNESLGRLLSSLLTARIGSVGLRTDPYRIILHFQVKALDILKDILFNTNPKYLRNYIEMHLSRSNLFEWKFVHVAKRFGAISRDAEYGRVRLGKIIDSYIGSPIFKETLAELETEKLDIEKATEILRKIQSKEIAVIFKPGLSILGQIGLRHESAELVGPPKPELEIFSLFKKRLMNTKIKLVCVNCGQWQQTFVVKEINEKTRCRKCDAKLLGIVHPKNMEAIKIAKKKIRGTIAEGEMKWFERLRKSADLFLVYGKKAAIALAARGVGPETGKRILARFHKDDDSFLRDILEEERRFIRTRKYWSS